MDRLFTQLAGLLILPLASVEQSGTCKAADAVRQCSQIWNITWMNFDREYPGIAVKPKKMKSLDSKSFFNNTFIIIFIWGFGGGVLNVTLSTCWMDGFSSLTSTGEEPNQFTPRSL